MPVDSFLYTSKRTVTLPFGARRFNPERLSLWISWATRSCRFSDIVHTEEKGFEIIVRPKDARTVLMMKSSGERKF